MGYHFDRHAKPDAKYFWGEVGWGQITFSMIDCDFFENQLGELHLIEKRGGVGGSIIRITRLPLTAAIVRI